MNEARKVAVVTGASAGVGQATARMLAQRGWHVIGVGRDPDRLAAAQRDIRAAATSGAQVDFLRADFTDMRAVRDLAGEIAALTPRLDVLINNAGGVRDARYDTVDGFEATLAANHLAPFVLTRALLPLLVATARTSAPGSVRVIAVSSSGHQGCAAMKWADLNMAEDFTPTAAYCQAKLANLLFTRELNRRAGADGIVAQAMHPGRVASNFASHGDPGMRTYMESADTVPPDVPAETLVWLATAADAGRDPGRYFHDQVTVEPAPQALDPDAARRLWTETEKMLERLDP